MHTQTTARSHTAKFISRQRVALAPDSRMLPCWPSRTLRDMTLPKKPTRKEIEYRTVKIMVPGSWMVRNSCHSKAALSWKKKELLKKLAGADLLLFSGSR